jgi:hypothetical protein
VKRNFHFDFHHNKNPIIILLNFVIINFYMLHFILNCEFFYHIFINLLYIFNKSHLFMKILVHLLEIRDSNYLYFKKKYHLILFYLFPFYF